MLRAKIDLCQPTSHSGEDRDRDRFKLRLKEHPVPTIRAGGGCISDDAVFYLFFQKQKLV